MASRIPPIRPPVRRRLQVYAFDPSRGRHLGNSMMLEINYEKLAPGPIGRQIAVIDYDAAQGAYYAPVDLELRELMSTGGLAPSEADPRFHQQMVYAVTKETIESFEAALGRRVHWRRAWQSPVTAPVHADAHRGFRLKLYPHAMADANAFYSRDAQGILYGYFRASETNPGNNLPHQTVFTCLSHDIIVHETTHAIVDGVRAYFCEASNPDVAAFHEAFADLAALFRHFSHRDVLIDVIQRSGGRLFDYQLAGVGAAIGADKAADGPIVAGRPEHNPLVYLALQFGDALGMNRGLRSALGVRADVGALARESEPHGRGAVLVAAVFDAFFSYYTARTANLFRVHRAGGARIDDDVPRPLAELLADEASAAARLFFKVCVRALEFCPTVDITFGDYLRSLITVHTELDPDDELEVRPAIMEAFRVRGIVARDAAYFAEEALLWPRPDEDALPEIEGLRFGDPNGLTIEERAHDARVLQAYFAQDAVRDVLQLARGDEIELPSFHPAFTVAPDGTLHLDMVIEAVQTRRVAFSATNAALGEFPLRGGATVIVRKPRYDGERQVFRHTISKPMIGRAADERAARQREHFVAAGHLDGTPDDDRRFLIDFALLHGVR
jgi:hypothetical protein